MVASAQGRQVGRAPHLRELVDSARAAGRRMLAEPDAKSLLAAYGIRVPRGRTVGAATAFQSDGMTSPFVAKIVSADVVHKSDIGGVQLGLADAAAVRAAIEQIGKRAHAADLRFDGVLVEEMAPAGVELVVGGLVDSRFGPVVMLGTGGVFVEILQDTVFRVCPISPLDAHSMIEELRGLPLLRGARGREPVDEQAIVDCLIAIGGAAGLLIEWENEIAELDINPLIVSRAGAVACDARVVLAQDAAG